MGVVLICYLIALLILVGGGIGCLSFLKKVIGRKWKGAHFFGGMVFSVAYVLGMLFLFRLTFVNEMFYNNAFFRTVLGFLYLLLLSFIRFLVIKIPFFDRDREDAGFSFSLGFGFAPGAFLAIYSLIMFFVVGINGLFNGPCVEEAEGLLGFADNTMISIFHPVGGHVSFAVLFALFAFFNLVFAWLIQKIVDERHSALSVFLRSLLLMALEAIMVLPVPFMKMYELAHYALPIIALIAAGIAFLAVRTMQQKKDQKPYIKQFE